MNFQSLMDERLPVWTALSELFLDTELQEDDIARIVAVLARSPYSSREVEAILKNEVSPAFAANLLSIAGEWQPWPEAQVREIMERSIRMALSTNFFDRIRSSLKRRIIPPEWHRIAVQLV
ncbi:hypothetical protein HL653_09505 [Sphingomonas sp. AP4-R1]|uniref:DUF7079 family protein n=1 Tax=Sphingomonas sp. AP4-R1 TaxID=2735134 RepID=UPI001493937A|nr:hypothetical protein [Sphingomonas sp. AP4-R1]QJU58001.1 hypothetical protein HL653_09505 [Sphingomonas sp. AP4-R1]